MEIDFEDLQDESEPIPTPQDESSTTTDESPMSQQTKGGSGEKVLPSHWMTIFGPYDLGWPIGDDQKRCQRGNLGRRQRSNLSRCRNEVGWPIGWPIKNDADEQWRRSRDNPRTTRWWWCQSDNLWGTRRQRGNSRRHVCLVSSYTLLRKSLNQSGIVTDFHHESYYMTSSQPF